MSSAQYKIENFEDIDLESGEEITPSEDMKLWRRKVMKRILLIRDEGKTNMLHIRVVCDIAASKGYLELVNFIARNKKGYWDFIMTGDKEKISCE